MRKRETRLDRMRAVEREYLAAAVATELLEERLRAEPTFLRSRKLRNRDARNLRGNLEGTFVIRLYAEFESGLRDVWQNAFGRDTHPPMRDLIAALGVRRYVPQDVIDSTNVVREYRNTLVHEGNANAEAIPLAEVRNRVCTFFSRMPLDW